MRQKNCTVLFLQYLYQTSIYSDNFWRTYTTVNLLSPAYFIFFRKAEIREPAEVSTIQRASALFAHSLQAALSRDARCLYSTQTVAIPNIPDMDYRIWAVLRE